MSEFKEISDNDVIYLSFNRADTPNCFAVSKTTPNESNLVPQDDRLNNRSLTLTIAYLQKTADHE